jgi:PhnB protein
MEVAMASHVKPIPDGFHTITPHLTVRDAKGAIEFYKKALGAQALNVSHSPDGKIMHATLKIGDSVIMMNDEFQEMGITGAPRGETPAITLHIYVDNVDKLFQQATGAGAKVKMPLQDQFWGDRYGTVIDPYGVHWSLGQHVKDVAPEEMQKAMNEMVKHPPQRKTA